MNDMKKLIDSVSPLFDDSVEADTDRYYADMERRETEAEENLPYDIEDAEYHFLHDEDGKKQYLNYFLENLVENPREGDIDLMIDIVNHYFKFAIGDKSLPMKFADAETMNDLIAHQLRRKGYEIDSSEVEKYRK